MARKGILSEKHRKFCEEYSVSLNATKAYIACGYSKNGAGASAGQLLKKPEIREYIKELQDARAARTQLSGDMVVKELARIVWPDNVEDEIDIRTSDRLKALEMLGRHFGVFERDNSQRRPFQDLTDEELAQRIEEMEARFKKKSAQEAN